MSVCKTREGVSAETGGVSAVELAETGPGAHGAADFPQDAAVCPDDVGVHRER